MATPRNRALCCGCGNLRTVSPSYRGWLDVKGSLDDNEHPEGWRCTITLKCSACNTRTQHAYLRDYLSDGRPDDKFRDVAETRQHLAPGTGLHGITHA